MFRFFDAASKAFWSMFDFVSSVRLAKEVKSDPDRSDYCVLFGMHAIFCGIGMLIAAVFVGLLLMLNIFSIPALNLVLGIAIAVGGGLLLAHTIKNWVLQIYITKNTMTWISLAVVLFCILGSVAILLGLNFA